MKKRVASLALVFSITLNAAPLAPMSIDDDLEQHLLNEMDKKEAAVSNGEPAADIAEEEPEPEYQASAPAVEAVQLYDQEDLVGWINNNQHLARVKADDCQLVEDIEARAEKVSLPAYEFLWGDMLAWGVCVDADPELGIYYMWKAANQGLAAALEQLGRYYANGIMVQQDYKKAIPLFREAAGQGYVKAQLQLVELYVAGMGSPYDYEDAYRWLHHSIIADKATHQKASQLLNALAQKMPEYVVERAKASNVPY